MVVVECSCGRIKEVRLESLISGITKTCGCGNRKALLASHTTHKKSKTRTYRIWQSMIQRCHNPKNTSYKNYGQRGIEVCELWRNSFEVFLQEMGECADKLTIDRINNDDGYYKENCRWTTHKENNRNRRDNIIINFEEQSMCLAEWAEKLDIKYTTMLKRYRKNKSIKEVLSIKCK